MWLIKMAGSVVILLLSVYGIWQQPPARLAPVLKAPASVNFEDYRWQDARSRFISSSLTQFAHAASITVAANGDRIAVWFAGSREGAGDVSIQSARFATATQQWLPEQTALTRQQLNAQLGLYNAKLGNPVIATAPDGTLWLFVVASNYFGWGSATINVLRSTDYGHSWGGAKRLYLTPFFNLSLLVRGAPHFYEDGQIALPAYRESLGKFPEWIRLDAEGQVVDKIRVAHGRSSLQPSSVVTGDNQITQFIRTAHSKQRVVLLSDSVDGGEHWSAVRASDMPNPNSGVSAVYLNDNNVLVAGNDTKGGRHQLSIYQTDKEAKIWKKIVELETPPADASDDFVRSRLPELLAHDVARNQVLNPQMDLSVYLNNIDADAERLCKENKVCEFYYDYPFWYRDAQNGLHLVYSWNKSFIKYWYWPAQGVAP